jgi:uncharacterized protein (DUF2249 family)
VVLNHKERSRLSLGPRGALKMANLKNIMTAPISLVTADKVMDVRPIPCSIKHGMILKTWFNLSVGDYFILLNDHDPVPLRYQFQAEFPGAYAWEYLERGPADFRVKITKTANVEASDLESPCGGSHN